MTAAAALPTSVDLLTWPGVVLAVDPDQRLSASNGRLELVLGRPVLGTPILDLLDVDSSGAKWERIAKAPGAATKPWELIFRGATSLVGPLTFSVLAGEDARVTAWLVEHPVDPRVAAMAGEMESVNADLATTQRELVIEQRRLASALAELARSNAALDEFAHVASHDLKAPLRAIADYSELLETDVGAELPEEQRGYLKRVNVLAFKMRRMIDDVLEYARAGREPSSYDRVNVGEVLRGVVEFLSPPADVRVDVDVALPTMRIPVVPFEQVFRNLIGNAIKYRRAQNASIRVSASDETDCRRFVVEDNGPGIPPSQQERIWNLFHTTRPGEGSGIGLAVVKRIVEAEGGRVLVESTAGEGSRFIVLWPKQPRPSVSVAR